MMRRLRRAAGVGWQTCATFMSRSTSSKRRSQVFQGAVSIALHASRRVRSLLNPPSAAQRRSQQWRRRQRHQIRFTAAGHREQTSNHFCLLTARRRPVSGLAYLANHVISDQPPPRRRHPTALASGRASPVVPPKLFVVELD
jgi:hypothetical protein